LKAVDNTLGQWCLGSNNYQLNLLLLSCFSQLLYIARVNIKILGSLSRAGITRSSVNFLSFGALGKFPDQGMLPGTTANNKYFYLPHPPFFKLCVSSGFIQMIFFLFNAGFSTYFVYNPIPCIPFPLARGRGRFFMKRGFAPLKLPTCVQTIFRSY